MRMRLLAGQGQRIAVSHDRGNTWAAQPALTSTSQPHQDIFVTPKGKTIAIARDDGTYTARNGTWSWLTSRQIANLLRLNQPALHLYHVRGDPVFELVGDNDQPAILRMGAMCLGYRWACRTCCAV